jgi:hypothetical protein
MFIILFETSLNSFKPSDFLKDIGSFGKFATQSVESRLFCVSEPFRNREIKFRVSGGSLKFYIVIFSDQ